MDASGERRGALASAQAEASLMHGHQAGGTGGIDGHVATMEVEEVGQPGSQDSVVAAGDAAGLTSPWL